MTKNMFEVFHKNLNLQDKTQKQKYVSSDFFFFDQVIGLPSNRVLAKPEQYKKFIEYLVNIKDKELDRVYLSSKDLSNIILKEVDLSFSDLNYTNLNKACLEDAYMNHISLTNASCVGLNLCRSTLASSNCFKTKFINANLSYTDFSYANLENADLTGATLTKAILYKTCILLAKMPLRNQYKDYDPENTMYSISSLLQKDGSYLFQIGGKKKTFTEWEQFFCLKNKNEKDSHRYSKDWNQIKIEWETFYKHWQEELVEFESERIEKYFIY